MSAVRHEFLNGEIFAMAGGTPAHAALSAAAVIVLGRRLEGRPCRPYSADLRIRVVATGLATYADAAVICGDPIRDPASPTHVTNPIVVVEVLRQSTEAYARARKPTIEGRSASTTSRSHRSASTFWSRRTSARSRSTRVPRVASGSVPFTEPGRSWTSRRSGSSSPSTSCTTPLAYHRGGCPLATRAANHESRRPAVVAAWAPWRARWSLHGAGASTGSRVA